MTAVSGHVLGVVLSAWAIVPPTIDGTIDPVEWAPAATMLITLYPNPAIEPLPPFPRTCTLYVMNDAINLYLAVAMPDTTPDPGDQCVFSFDNDHDGIFEEGDDCLRIWGVRPVTVPPEFWDLHFNFSTPGWTEDWHPRAHGTIDGSGDATHVAGINYFEFSHPLDSADDAHDFSLSLGDTVGFTVWCYDNGCSQGWFPGEPGVPEEYGDIIIAQLPTLWTETIYIRADGSVNPDTAPISTVDNITYRLTDNIAGDVPEGTSAIVVQRDNIVVDGAGYTLQGAGAYDSKGINLTGRSNVKIRSMEIKAFWHGIYLEDSSNNSISGNKITNRDNGIYLSNSSNNKFCHNNFANPTQVVSTIPYLVNVWDNGYPSGGNYWSDYVDKDEFSGPNQDQLGSDGIGDKSYVIDANNTDSFPLVGPISFFNAGTWHEVTYYVYTVSNSTVSDFNFDLDNYLISFGVTGSNGTVGFCRVTIPNELLWCDNPDQWEVWVNNTLIEDGKVMEDPDYTYIYFTYNQSTQNVDVIGVHVIPEFPTALLLPLFLIFTLIAVALTKKICARAKLSLKQRRRLQSHLCEQLGHQCMYQELYQKGMPTRIHQQAS